MSKKIYKAMMEFEADSSDYDSFDEFKDDVRENLEDHAYFEEIDMGDD